MTQYGNLAVCYERRKLCFNRYMKILVFLMPYLQFPNKDLKHFCKSKPDIPLNVWSRGTF